jgi:hypothetical protein
MAKTSFYKKCINGYKNASAGSIETKTNKYKQRIQSLKDMAMLNINQICDIICNDSITTLEHMSGSWKDCLRQSCSNGVNWISIDLEDNVCHDRNTGISDWYVKYAYKYYDNINILDGTYRIDDTEGLDCLSFVSGPTLLSELRKKLPPYLEIRITTDNELIIEIPLTSAN